MVKSLRKLLAIVLVLLVSPSLLLAQQQPSDWNNVEKLKPGSRIIVRTKQGVEYAGEKRKANDDTLFLEIGLPVHGTRILALSRDEIAQVRRTKSRLLPSLIGGAAGAGAGGVIGDSVYDHRGGDDPHSGALILGFVGAMIGVAIANLVVRKKAKQIYVAP